MFKSTSSKEPLRTTSSVLVVAIFGMSPTVHAELPAFPKDSIAPLYGQWVDGQGRSPQSYSIGPKWITSFRGQCAYRYQYRIMKIELVKDEHFWRVQLEDFNPQFLGKKMSAIDCFGQDLLKLQYTYFRFGDVGEPSDAPIDVIVWETCDTAEGLKRLVDGKDPRYCGGGIRERITPSKSS
jgi:hypothetical protein